MTYRDLVLKIQKLCDAHDIIKDFGYGAMSDMKTVNNETNVTFQSEDTPYTESLTNYPYVYLNPTQSTRTSQTITYRFNMIVMDIALDRQLPTTYDTEPSDLAFYPYLQVQSDCQQYIDDIISGLRFGVTGTGGIPDGSYDPKIDVQLNVNLTPFKERFQDTVAGMTAILEIEIAQPMNECIAPYN